MPTLMMPTLPMPAPPMPAPPRARLRLPARPLLLLALASAVVGGTPVLAQPGWGGGYGGFGGGYGGGYGRAPMAPARDSREGRVAAERFVGADALQALGHGAIVVKTLPGSTIDDREQGTYEAAIVDQLAKAGYNTQAPADAGGQITEITISHDMLEPAEEKRKPLSGAVEMGVSNRGSMMGVQLNYDATKPRGALISTSIELRIRDRATGAALYEARARIATREGDSHWTDQAVATRLAGAAFEHFPSNSN